MHHTQQVRQPLDIYQQHSTILVRQVLKSLSVFQGNSGLEIRELNLNTYARAEAFPL